MAPRRMRLGSWNRVGETLAAVTIVLVCATAARAQDCSALLSLFQQGRSTAEIARATGMTRHDVKACRQQLRRPIFVGPQGPPPLGAVGPAPRNAAGPPPLGAAGPPPFGAAGPPPVGHDVKRLP
jgi:hypothetical protein